jgi:hypothetical protein
MSVGNISNHQKQRINKHKYFSSSLCNKHNAGHIECSRCWSSMILQNSHHNWSLLQFSEYVLCNQEEEWYAMVRVGFGIEYNN